MKISIITMHGIKNYGSALQTYATQEFFKKYVDEVEIINYIRKDARNENLVEFWAKGNLIKKIIIYPTIRRWIKIFDRFYEKNVKISDGIFSDEEDFKKYKLDSDLYCVGSDQVWNSKWNLGIEYPLYLSFLPDISFRFSFASSFGQSYLDENEVEKTKEYLQKFRFISVREDSGKKIIENQYGLPKAYHLIDPTLCLTGDEWRKLANTIKKTQNYILIYNLNRSREFDLYAKRLSQKTGLKLVRFCTRYDQIFRVGKSKLVPEVIEFIKLIDNAKYVLTDSFHATAFSMNLNTEPICVYPEQFGGRLESFLKMIDSEDRHVKNYDDFEVINSTVDFNKINNILEREREKSCDYMRMVISEYNNVDKSQ